MTNILVLGSGKIGVGIAQSLIDSGDFQVALGDGDADSLAERAPEGAEKLVVDATDGAALKEALQGRWAVINALPYFLNARVASAARQESVHYFDLSEDVSATREVRAIAEGAGTLFAPQCGLAPGFISIVAHHLVHGFDEAHDLRLRVGALAQFPDNVLRYNLTWSTEGLINEYCNPCEIIHDGARREVLPLEGLERFSLDGVNYEAFATSGGIGSLCETLDGKVRNLSYKTVRYPGHRDMIQMLANDLKLCENRETFKHLIETGIPITRQDVVIIFVTVTGLQGGMLAQESFVRKVYGDTEEEGRSAIQKTTAAGVLVLVDLKREGKLADQGFLRLEQVPFEDFMGNRFAEVFA
ncbi:MAG: saccharopine dehydrogenase C-terminal domain-containing protein [Rhodospirillales bacterium]|jgi:saccharopine dehydrogenase-like NADP-dependent oxidoreductase|nr:saccharopine dehydrogenase [Rhodospirillaceae bacterium]MDP6429053.1 saccharopine dehydrogenase C-terminal domain-containing protein [Rhodospirillales bacterium]MDP6644255.1 saccharopine dehydrogenase C-terminal domain-containing protein [Rhodospirillales bacterium]|tara:strand:- start:1600 stop:2667 length:1068 start_codon:yes stop_codon:yes gene_type:complete